MNIIIFHHQWNPWPLFIVVGYVLSTLLLIYLSDYISKRMGWNPRTTYGVMLVTVWLFIMGFWV